MQKKYLFIIFIIIMASSYFIVIRSPFEKAKEETFCGDCTTSEQSSVAQQLIEYLESNNEKLYIREIEIPAINGTAKEVLYAVRNTFNKTVTFKIETNCIQSIGKRSQEVIGKSIFLQTVPEVTIKTNSLKVLKLVIKINHDAPNDTYLCNVGLQQQIENQQIVSYAQKQFYITVQSR